MLDDEFRKVHIPLICGTAYFSYCSLYFSSLM